MTQLRAIIGGGERAEDKTAKAAEDIKAMIYDRLSGMPLATAVGVLEIVKMEIVRDNP